MALTKIGTESIKDDAVTADKLANSINTEIAANTAKTTNATHTGDVTGSGALTIADNAVTLAKMASGTDGQIITYDASGDPVAVGPGTDGQVLTSTGAGSPPAFETLPASGKILQVVTAVATGTASKNNTTFSEITTDLRCTITPTSASSKIIVTAILGLHETGGGITIRILKDGTTMVNQPSGYVSSTADGNTYSVVNSANNQFHQPVQVIETAGNTTQRYYTPFWASVSGTAYFNTWSTVNFTETTSTMTVMEVAA